MSSIAKANISLSKKDLSKSRIPLVGTRNVTFYHKATAGDLSINLLALSMPSEMPTNVQATVAEISGANLAINKKNLSLVSSANGLLMSGLHYVVTSSTTIQLIGLYEISGAEVDEIFTGSINAAPVTDLVVASARSVDKTYTLAVGQTILNLGREYQTGQNINDDIGSIKVFVNGVLAHRDTDYAEVDAGSGYGTTISFYAAPVSLPYSIAVDFGVMSITDNDAIGTIENLAGAIKKIAVDLADVAGTSESDYYSASPSEIERRTFGDMVLDHSVQLLKYDTTQNLSEYTKTKWQKKYVLSLLTGTGAVSDLTFNNLTIGKTYRASGIIRFQITGAATDFIQYNLTGASTDMIAFYRHDTAGFNTASACGFCVEFVAQSTTLGVSLSTNSTSRQTTTATFMVLEELPNHEVTSQWT